MSLFPFDALRRQISRGRPWYRPRLLPRLHPLSISIFIGVTRVMVGILGVLITTFALYSIYRGGEQSNVREVEDLAFVINNALEDPMSELFQGQSSPAEIESILNQYLEKRTDIRYAILRPNGEPMPLVNEARVIQNISPDEPEIRAARSNIMGQSIREDVEHEKHIFVATAIGNSWTIYGILVLAVPFNDVMIPTYQSMGWVSLISLVIGIFLIAEGWLNSEYLTQPVMALNKVAERLSEGDLTARAEPEGPVEMVHFAQTFNVMAARLQTSMDTMHAFVANASHELRTPLTSIKLYIGALRGGALEEPKVADRFLNQVECELDRLSRMVNDLLDLSQIESGGNLRDTQPVNLVELTQEVEAFWAARAQQAGIRLSLQAAQDIPVLKGDPYQLRRVFDNLLDNAIKNTPTNGQVEICLSRVRRKDEDVSTGNGSQIANGNGRGDVVHVEVRDTGAGIAPEHLPHLFDRFYRVNGQNGALPKNGANAGLAAASANSEPCNCKSDGTGLGLAIARSIVLAHSGQIGVNSQLGTGSVFWIDLPIWD